MPDRRRLWPLLLPLFLGLLGVGWWALHRPSIIDVPGNYPTINSALASVPNGTVIRLAPGVYDESLVLDRPVTIEGPIVGEATVRGDFGRPTVTVIDTHDVTLRRLTITGGKYGVLVRQSQDITITENHIAHNQLRGVRVVYASAHILNNTVLDTFSPYGKGIHIANSMSWPVSVVEGNIVEQSGSEGIVTNMARTVIRSNIVRDNELRGIAVLEMSIATVEDNTIVNSADAGLYIVDMSTAEVAGNVVTDTRAGPTGLADGIRMDYHAEANIAFNQISSNDGCGIAASKDSIVTGTDNFLGGNRAQALCGDLSLTLLSLNIP